MAVNLIWELAIVALAVGFGWLVWRAWCAKRKLWKWTGVPLAGLFALILLLVAVLGGRGIARAYTPRGNPVSDAKVTSIPAKVARGEHIAALLCASCHTTNNELPLTGVSTWRRRPACRWAI